MLSRNAAWWQQAPIYDQIIAKPISDDELKIGGSALEQFQVIYTSVSYTHLDVYKRQALWQRALMRKSL